MAELEALYCSVFNSEEPMELETSLPACSMFTKKSFGSSEGIKSKREEPSFEFEEETIKLTKRIGTGTFSEVYSVTADGRPMCLKKLINVTSLNDSLIELAIGSSFRHPNIVPILGISSSSSLFGFLMPLCDMSLDNRLRYPYSLEERFEHMRQLANGFSYLHSNRILHLDIKSQNVLVRNGDVLISDFGLSTILAPCMPGLVGHYFTETHRPIEHIIDSSHLYSFSSDIWALAIVFFEILTSKKLTHIVKQEWIVEKMGQIIGPSTKKLPPPNIIRTKKNGRKITKEEREEQMIPTLPGLSPYASFTQTLLQDPHVVWTTMKLLTENWNRSDIVEFQDLLNGMLRRDPSKRFTIAQVVSSPFLLNESMDTVSSPVHIDLPEYKIEGLEDTQSVVLVMKGILEYSKELNVSVASTFLAIDIAYRCLPIIGPKDEIGLSTCVWMATKFYEDNYYVSVLADKVTAILGERFKDQDFSDMEIKIASHLRGVIFRPFLYNRCKNFSDLVDASRIVLKPDQYIHLDIGSWARSRPICDTYELKYKFSEIFSK